MSRVSHLLTQRHQKEIGHMTDQMLQDGSNFLFPKGTSDAQILILVLGIGWVEYSTLMLTTIHSKETQQKEPSWVNNSAVWRSNFFNLI